MSQLDGGTVRDLYSADKKRKSPRGSGIAKSMTYPSSHATRTHDSRRLNRMTSEITYAVIEHGSVADLLKQTHPP